MGTDDGIQQVPEGEWSSYPSDKSGAFCTTHWTVVLDAKNGSSQSSAVAWGKLCGTYWYPLYAFIRRRGSNAHEAEDLTQSFFANVLGKDFLRSVGRENGKFRTFLLASLVNFLNSEWARQNAQKRGGRNTVESWDALAAEDRYLNEPAHDLNPEKLFEQRWAWAVVEQVLAGLQAEYKQGGKLGLYHELQTYLTDEVPEGFYEATAERLKMTSGAAKVALHRLRRRFGERLRDQIATTVSSPTEVDDEIRHLLASLSDAK